MSARRWTLLGRDRQLFQSESPGKFGGHLATKIYGRLDCPAALRALARGDYVKNRVFFRDAVAARAAGFRPCAVCMPEAYRRWKNTSSRRAG